MFLTVQYLRDADDPSSLCWKLSPLTDNLEEAIELARFGMSDVSTHMGATAFQIVDNSGRILGTERYVSSAAPIVA